jgi:protocatechuate 3,4-dioxygenase beta subunit
MDREQAEILYDEIDRLPGAFRLPVVLCYFEGLTLDEAARRLSWPQGTLRSRLARAREKLRRGLTRRGVVLPAAALAAALESKPASASVSSPLCEITTKAAMNFAAGHAATALAREVLRSMLIPKLKLAVLTVLLLGAVAGGAGFVGQVSVPQAGKPDLREHQAGKPDRRPAPGRMFVTGRVLDPDGRRVSGAAVMVSARSKAIGSSIGLATLSPEPIGHASTDGSGRFRLDAPRTSSSRYDRLSAIAVAPGYGLGWLDLDPDIDEPSADLALVPEQVIRGRLFDIAGRPARGVTVSVWSILRTLQRDPRDPRFERSDGLTYRWSRAHDMPGWPRPATTDADGRFTLHGIGRGLHVSLAVIDPRFALQVIELKTDADAETKPLTMALQPARVLTGRVTHADTGKPVDHARIIVYNLFGRAATRTIDYQTDADGRFRANPEPGEVVGVMAVPPEGEPYLSAQTRYTWAKGQVEHSVDLALPRGVLIRGKVTEEGSGKPVPGATVMYVLSLGSTPNRGNGAARPVETQPDGSFQLAIRPEPGRLAIQAPSDDYVFNEASQGLLFQGRPGGRRIYTHAVLACDPKPDGTGQEVSVALRRGATVQGRVVGPDDRPVRDAWLISRLILRPDTVPWRSWRPDEHGTAREGRFELHGLDHDTEVPVYFLDPKGRMGATARFSGRSMTQGPITVRLEPCGTAKARLVGPDGMPLPGFAQPWLISMDVTPQGTAGPNGRNPNPLPADGDLLTRIDPVNYPQDPAADAQGRIAFPALIPGATYRLLGRVPRAVRSPQLNRAFTVKPGETMDLGDIRIEKPTRE